MYNINHNMWPWVLSLTVRRAYINFQGRFAIYDGPSANEVGPKGQACFYNR